MTLDEAFAAIDKRGWRIFMLGHNAGGSWILDAIEKNARTGELPVYVSSKGRTALEACENWLKSGKRWGRGTYDDPALPISGPVYAALKEALDANREARYVMDPDDAPDFLGL